MYVWAVEMFCRLPFIFSQISKYKRNPILQNLRGIWTKRSIHLQCYGCMANIEKTVTYTCMYVCLYVHIKMWKLACKRLPRRLRKPEE